MDDVEKRNKIKLFKAISIIFVTLLLGEEWIVTQLVANECEYNPVLDWYIAINETYIYFPLDYYRWCNNELIYSAIPDILNSYSNYRFLVVMVTGVLMFMLSKGINNKTTHGSASFASHEDINSADLGQYISKNGGNYEYKKTPIKLFGITLYHKKEKILKDSGVVVGINPYTGKLMLHDGVEHVLLMAPTRSGKGVCTIIPTGLVWKHSIFFFDPKGELWSLTSGYRKKYLKQKVMKFQPLCIDGSSARWNPLAEVNYRTNEELSDVSTIVSVMVRPDGEQKGGDSFWPDSAAALLNGVILHLLYKHNKENRPLPCPTDIMSFLSSPDMDTNELFSTMRDYPHISPKEFLEEEMLDDKGNKIIDPLTNKPKHLKNPLKEIYGEYIKEFKPFSDALGIVVCSMDEIRIAIKQTINTTSRSSGKGLFDGSVSTSQTGRELMTPDEISHMSSEKELVFVAGHKAIFGNKLRYYEHSWLLNRTKLGHPVTSDSVTEVKNYKELFAVHAADAKEKEKEKITVLRDKAQKLGLTYEDYVNKLNKERENREKEIIARITGGIIESPQTNSDEKCREDSESKKGEEVTRNEQERKSSPPLNIRKSVEQEFNNYKNQKRMKANTDFKQQDMFDVLNEEKNE